MTHYLTEEIPVPDEATHIAQDADGIWCFYDGEPSPSVEEWMGSYISNAYQGDPPANWRDQCYEIERE